MALTLVTPPSGDLLTKGELLSWVRADDLLANATEVMRLALAAESSFREYTGRVLRQSTWKWTKSLFPSRPFRIPWVPVRSVSLVRYRDTAGDWQTVSADDYQSWEEGEGGFTYLAAAPNLTWPTVETSRLGAVEITFVAGMYATGTRPDEEILLRHKIYVAKFFNQRMPDVADEDWLANLWAPWMTGEVI